MQPSGQALTFEDGKVTLVESRAICRYVADKYAEKGNKDLIGKGTLERASVEQWLQTEAHNFEPPSSALVFNLALAPLMGWHSDEAVLERSKEKVNKVLDIYEQRLQETRYLAGDKFTLADLSHLPNAYKLMTACIGCSSMFKSRKWVNKWCEDILNCPSWKTVVAMQQEPPPAA